MRRTIKTITLAGLLALGGLLIAGSTPAEAQLFGISVPGFQMSVGGPGYYGAYPGVYGYGAPYGGGYYGGYPYVGSYSSVYGYPGAGVGYYSGYPGFGYSSYRTYSYSPFGYRRGYYGFRRRGLFGW